MFKNQKRKTERMILEKFPEKRCMYAIRELEIEKIVIEKIKKRMNKKGDKEWMESWDRVELETIENRMAVTRRDLNKRE